MSVAKLDEHADGSASVLIDCPGCGMLHAPGVRAGSRPDFKVWGWNGSLDAPTFTPSILVTCEGYGPENKRVVCHSFVTDGRIQFLGDCTHALAGQTVQLEEWNP